MKLWKETIQTAIISIQNRDLFLTKRKGVKQNNMYKTYACISFRYGISRDISVNKTEIVEYE